MAYNLSFLSRAKYTIYLLDQILPNQAKNHTVALERNIKELFLQPPTQEAMGNCQMMERLKKVTAKVADKG